jgi:hypothetical protein
MLPEMPKCLHYQLRNVGSTEAKAALMVADDAWQRDGDLFWACAPQAPAGERWVVVRTTAGEDRA